MNPEPPARVARILLVDNGSRQPSATLALRRLAARLGDALGEPVDPVSLLHADAVPANKLEGRSAEVLGPALRRRAQSGLTDLVIVPLFFGPSAAVTRGVPGLVRTAQAAHRDLRVRVARCLVDPAQPGDDRIAAMLADHIRARAVGMARPAVILVDHGSPTPAVGAVRDLLAGRITSRLGPEVRAVLAASMERRPGPEFDFNEPLLARAFGRPGFDRGDVIVAMQFLLPGRHAGPNGDVARICSAAQERHAGLRPAMTELVGTHPGLVALLAERAREAAAAGTPGP